MRRFLQLIAALGVMLGAGWAQAALFDVVIDDLTETPFATVNGAPVTLLPDSNGEFIHFSMPFSFSGANFGGLTFSFDLFEPVTLLLSDRLLETATDHVDIRFSSDPATFPPQGSFIVGSAVENGTFQTLYSHQYSSSGSDTFTYRVRSDIVEAVPEPSTYLLLATGLLVLLGYGRQRRRHVA